MSIWTVRVEQIIEGKYEWSSRCDNLQCQKLTWHILCTFHLSNFRGGKVHFSTNCTILWDQVPFVRHREQTKNNETIEIAYLNETIVSVLKLDKKGQSICHATRDYERNSCGEEFGLQL